MFSSGDAAEIFCKRVPRTCVKKAKCGVVDVMSECYAAGARTLIEHKGYKETQQTLEEKALRRRYYNPDLSADTARYIHTHKDDYLKIMRECRFIVPVKIRNHPEVSVEYATVILQGLPYMYLVFTDLEEYGKWEKQVPGWHPLEVGSDGLQRIGRKHGFFLNPCGSKIIISGKMLETINEEEEGEGEDTT